LRGAVDAGERTTVPVVARFYGIAIKMYFSQSEHGVPHFHAIYGERAGVFGIEPLRLIEGDLPPRAQRLVTEWAERYRSDLLEMWNTQAFRELPGLE
jgi:hypothetical protein